MPPGPIIPTMILLLASAAAVFRGSENATVPTLTAVCFKNWRRVLGFMARGNFVVGRQRFSGARTFTNLLRQFDNPEPPTVKLTIMKLGIGVIGGCVALLVAGCAHPKVGEETSSPTETEFVGSTPGEELVRA